MKLCKWFIRRKSLLLLITALVLTSVAASHAATIRTLDATVTRIADGDTVIAVTPEGTKLKIRLYGIDAPETERGKIPGAPFGGASKNYLAALVDGKDVRVEILDIDRHRRMVAILWLGNRNINLEMIVAGMAEAYVEHLKKPSRGHFLQAEQEARSRRKGVWSQGNLYERPSDFRKRMGG